MKTAAHGAPLFPTDNKSVLGLFVKLDELLQIRHGALLRMVHVARAGNIDQRTGVGEERRRSVDTNPNLPRLAVLDLRRQDETDIFGEDAVVCAEECVRHAGALTGSVELALEALTHAGEAIAIRIGVLPRPNGATARVECATIAIRTAGWRTKAKRGCLCAGMSGCRGKRGSGAKQKVLVHLNSPQEDNGPGDSGTQFILSGLQESTIEHYAPLIISVGKDQYSS